VEVAALERGAFERLVAGSAPIREAIDRTVEMRVAENEAARGQRGNGHA